MRVHFCRRSASFSVNHSATCSLNIPYANMTVDTQVAMCDEDTAYLTATNGMYTMRETRMPS